MNTVYFLVQQTMFFSIPLLIVALGGMFSERSGVVNIALEGIMIMGAFSSILFINIVQSSGAALPPQLLLLLAVLIAAAVGVLVSMAHAYASINMKADQVISGTAINMFAPAFAIFAARMIRSVQQIPFSNTFRITKVPVLGDIPVLGPLLFQNTYITTYLGFAVLAVSAVVLYKTRFGLRLRACGEHPAACDTLGINVLGIRFFSVCMSGFLAGLGGASVTMATMNQFRPTSIVGQGFIAIAAVIFGKFRPQGAMWACLLFGMCSGLKIVLGSSNVVSAQLISMIPFVVTVIVLILFVGRSQVPAANGKPYIKSK